MCDKLSRLQQNIIQIFVSDNIVRSVNFRVTIKLSEKAMNIWYIKLYRYAHIEIERSID